MQDCRIACVTLVAALACAGPASAQPAAGPAFATRAAVMAAPGQVDYPCTGAAPNICPEFKVQVSAIPTVPTSSTVTPTYLGCVAALPYRALRIAMSRLDQTKTTSVVWRLDLPLGTGLQFRFADPGIVFNSINPAFMGEVKDMLQSNPVISADGQTVTVSVNSQAASRLFYGNHLPRVQFWTKNQNPLTDPGADCVPVDPIITNSEG